MSDAPRNADLMTDLHPPQALGLEPSFGFGDRLGLATPGHIDAVRSQAGPILPVFAQQSMSEMACTRRKPSDVMEDVTAALRAASYTGAWSADADHLKTQEDVNATAGAGFVRYTIDPSDHLDLEAESYDLETLDSQFAVIRDDVNWTEEYVGRTVQLGQGVVIEFDPATVRRIAVKCGRAIAHAIKLAAHIDRVLGKRGSQYEVELSMDEVAQPTTLAEHYIIAEQCLRSHMKLISLALRYRGTFERAVDFQGNVRAFGRSLAEHTVVARELGPYKLSLHAGSDKLAIYESFARITGGRFHVKTSGTSYLEALRVAARHDRKLFRRIAESSRKQFDQLGPACRRYVSARLDKVPTPAAVCDDAVLEKLYLDQSDGRQILHVTYPAVLGDSSLGPALRDVLEAEPNTHRDVLARHFRKHLKALCRGL